jgi:hypothetical protein
MCESLCTLALWWVVYAAGYAVQYVGPYPSESVCMAAAAGATEFGMPSVCLPVERIDDYLMGQIESHERGDMY